MTTITINNLKVEQKYTPKELEMKFLVFIQQEVQDDSIELYQISTNDLESKSQDRLKNIEKLNFINY